MANNFNVLDTPASSGIAETLIDAAGDLIVGSAADTAARLAKGTALQVLRVNSAGTALEYATAASSAVAEGRPAISGTGQIMMPGIEGTGLATNTLGSNEVLYGPWYVASSITIDQLLVEVTSAGAAGKLIRLGLYNADANWQPTTRLADGSVAADGALGMRSLSVSLTLPAGRYLTAVNTDGTPAIRGVRGGQRYMGFVTTVGSSGFVAAWKAAQAYGAFPDPGLAAATATGSSSIFLNYVFARVTSP